MTNEERQELEVGALIVSIDARVARATRAIGQAHRDRRTARLLVGLSWVAALALLAGLASMGLTNGERLVGYLSFLAFIISLLALKRFTHPEQDLGPEEVCTVEERLRLRSYVRFHGSGVHAGRVVLGPRVDGAEADGRDRWVGPHVLTLTDRGIRARTAFVDRAFSGSR